MQPKPGQRERILLYTLLTALTAVSIDALLPGLRGIGAELSASSPLAPQHLISLFILGMAFGELAIGPLSDAVGRKPALLLGLGIYVAGTVVALVAESMEMLVMGRVLQGIGVAGPKIATRAMIRDQFSGDEMARVMSFMFALMIAVPMLAPALGQGVLALTGWRGIFGLYLVMALILGLWLAWRQPETLVPAHRVPVRPGLLWRNALRVLGARRVSLLIAATGFVFGALLLYLGTAAELFFDAYGIGAAFPVYFALLAAATGLASLVNARLVRRVGMERMVRGGFVGLVVAGMALLALAALWQGRPPLALFLLPGFAAFFALGILFGNLNALAMRSLGQLAGLGASLIASGSSLVATGFAVAFGAFYDGTTTYLGAGFLVAGLAAFLLSELAAGGDTAPVVALRDST